MANHGYSMRENGRQRLCPLRGDTAAFWGRAEMPAVCLVHRLELEPHRRNGCFREKLPPPRTCWTVKMLWG
jgi:hypothetical protein